jgi:hypothetical protein
MVSRRGWTEELVLVEVKLFQREKGKVVFCTVSIRAFEDSRVDVVYERL